MVISTSLATMSTWRILIVWTTKFSRINAYLSKIGLCQLNEVWTRELLTYLEVGEVCWAIAPQLPYSRLAENNFPTVSNLPFLHWYFGIWNGYSCYMTEARRRRGRVFSSSESRPGGSGWYIADRDKHRVQLLYDRWPKFLRVQVPGGIGYQWPKRRWPKFTRP